MCAVCAIERQRPPPRAPDMASHANQHGGGSSGGGGYIDATNYYAACMTKATFTHTHIHHLYGQEKYYSELTAHTHIWIILKTEKNS